ncbi:MAG: beta-glucosidase [Actinomycetota bacterium]
MTGTTGTGRGRDEEVERRIDELLAAMTLDERAALSAGIDLWHGPGVARLGVPPIKATDGPSGARGQRWTGRPVACFPSGSTLGASWDPDLVRTVGARLGAEARRRQAHMLLAPTVNLHRHPLAGRNFECPAEDPFLSARYAVAYVEGVQSAGVACAIKHFTANDSEFERMTISSVVDERTLREVSLRPFEAAVREAGVWALMTAYNRVNGTFCSEHADLLGVLRDEWGFDGVVISDWFGTHSTVPTARAGLDLEMPGPAQWLGPHLADAVRAGDVPEAVATDKARRVLRLIARTGRLGEAALAAEEHPDDPADRAVARRAAAESIVLLRNDAAALPLGPDVRTLAVIGPNADAEVIQGGGSARVEPHSAITALAGLRARFEAVAVAVVHEPGCPPFNPAPVLDHRVLAGPIRVEYFADRERTGEPVLVEEVRRAHLQYFLGSVPAGVPTDFALRLRADFVPPVAGEWTFSLVQVGRARLTIDGEPVVDNWHPSGHSALFMGFGSERVSGRIAVEAGRRYEVVVELVPPRGAGAIEVGCAPPTPTDLRERAVAAARTADAVVCIVGTDPDWETEGRDRDTLALPPGQDDLVRAVIAANPRTVVVVNAGAPVAMPWADTAAAVVWLGLPGQEGGDALADVLSGDCCPSGKLPTTIPYRLEDTPAFASYPGVNGEVHYTEGVCCGHRWYDTHGIEPQFCFGYGLSYTTFAIGVPSWVADASVLRVPVTNTGDQRGAEVVQCYVHDVEASVVRPDQELAAFAKVWLDPGETATVELPLTDRAFAFWDVGTGDWRVEPGAFELRVGTSSRDLRHTVTVTR